MRPCVWQAALMTAIWYTALRECLATLGDTVFSCINDLLDFQCAPTDSAAPDSLVVKQSAMQFLSHREGGMRYAVRNKVWNSPLISRLIKQALLETCTSQRLSVRALSQLRDEAQLQGFTPLSQQVNSTLGFLQKTSQQSAAGGEESKTNHFLSTPNHFPMQELVMLQLSQMMIHFQISELLMQQRKLRPLMILLLMPFEARVRQHPILPVGRIPI